MITEYELPLVPSIGSYRLTTTLAAVPYTFDLRWNTRDVAWYMDMYEVNLTPIIYGMKIVLGAYLGRRVDHEFFRKGVLVAEDTSGAAREATFDDLGVRVIVKYIPVLDLARRLTRSK